MTKVFRFAPGVILLLYIALKVAPHIHRVFPPALNNPDVPSPEVQRMLGDVRATISEHPDAAKQFRDMYTGMSVVVGSDEVVLRTTDDVRRAHENAGALAIQAGKIPRIPGYAEAVNEYLIQRIGTDNLPLDRGKREQIAGAFKELAWAME